MKCNKCIGNIEMAQIPYIEHEYRIYKAYEREKRLKLMLIGTNILWALVVIMLVVG